jgi:hypothetical protein
MLPELNTYNIKGHFTHEPRAVTMKSWEPKRKWPKAIRRHLQNNIVWSWIVKCSVKSYVTGPQPIAILMNFYSCGFSHIIKLNKSTIVSIRSDMVSWFVLSLPPKDDSWKWFMWSWNMTHMISRRNSCRLYIHLAFTYSIGPSTVVWIKLGPALPFPPMKVLEV